MQDGGDEASMDVSDDGSITTTSESLGTRNNGDIRKRKDREDSGEALNENPVPRYIYIHIHIYVHIYIHIYLYVFI
jgi:hypothetical protein